MTDDPTYPSTTPSGQPPMPTVTTAPTSRNPYAAQSPSSSTSVLGDVKNYVLSIFGILKLVQLVLCLFGIIFAGASQRDIAAGGFFIFVAVLFLIATLALFVIYALHLHHKFDIIPWIILELVFNAVAIFLFFLASIILAVKCDGAALLIMAVIIGFVTCIAYGGAGFLAFLEFRSGGDPAGIPA